MTWLPRAKRKAWLAIPVFAMVIFPLGPARQQAVGQRNLETAEAQGLDRTLIPPANVTASAHDPREASE